MDGRFIYVFSEQDRDELTMAGLKLLGSDEKTHTYIFINDTAKFAKGPGVFVLSDTLTF